MTPPEGFRRSRFDWFGCPSCGYEAFSCYWAAQVGANRKSVSIVYWCRSCGRFCTLKHQWLMPLVAFGVLGPVLFGLAFWWGAGTGIGEWLLTIAGLLLAGHATFILIGRVAKKFIPQR